MGVLNFGVGYENHTSHPSKGRYRFIQEE
nr:hypothetical protein [Desulfitobacterium dichloroeliminans]